jgi:hypothetical protein
VIHLAENFFIPNHVARCENHVNKKCSKSHSLAQFVEPPKSYHAKHRFFSGGHRNGNSDAVFISDLHFSLFKLSDPIFLRGARALILQYFQHDCINLLAGQSFQGTLLPTDEIKCLLQFLEKFTNYRAFK